MSINLRTNEIKDIFSIFDDPLDKYTEIIEFGRKNDSFDEKYKLDSYKIPGCASLAWVYVKKNNSKYKVHTSSEAHIVKGLLYILEYIINESTKDEIFNLSILEILSQIGLDKSITSQRTNGFLNALNKIKEQINNYEK
tara:strand:+ start:72 stop:488 length:417 start_codon:yes stop_codon:yes gene_type:complete